MIRGGTSIQDLAQARLGTGGAPAASSFIYSGAYTGNGAAGKTVTGLGFMPDVVLIKKIGGTNANPSLWDRTQIGVGNYLPLSTTGAIITVNGITSFDADGFTLGADAVANESARDYVFIALKEVTFGFDATAHGGTGVAHTVSHALGIAPSLLLVKSSDVAALDWASYCVNRPTPEGVAAAFPNSTVDAASATFWNNTLPSPLVFTVGTSTRVNDGASTPTYLDYLFAEAGGAIKVSTYTGNATIGKAITGLGFKPYGLIIFRRGTNNDSVLAVQRQAGDTMATSQLGVVTAATLGFTITSDADGFTLNTVDARVNANTEVFDFIAFGN